MPDKVELPTVDGERCETCKFWLRKPDFIPPAGNPSLTEGLCRRGLRHVAYSAVDDDSGGWWGQWQWPPHEGTDWCGEWRAKGT